MGFFLRNVTSAHRTCLYLWILGVYPVYCVTSIIGMYIPRSSTVCNFVASIYHSMTLWKFLALITDFFGGKTRMLEELEGEKVAPNPVPCCCCCCLPNISVNRVSLRWMTIAVFQLSAVRTILFFLCLILWTDEKYDYGDVDYTSPNSYINILIGISTFLSFYGYLLFYKATRNALQGFSLRSKFICIILVLVLCGLQSGILETMGALGAIPCIPPFSVQTRSQIIFYYSLTVEMFFIGIFARFCFRKVEPSPEAVHLDRRVKQPKVHKSSQTNSAYLPSPGMSDTDDLSLGANPSHLSDSEDSLCHIEHAPLDRFEFEMAQKLQMGFWDSKEFIPPADKDTKSIPRELQTTARLKPNSFSPVRKHSRTEQEDQTRNTSNTVNYNVSHGIPNGIQVHAQINYINANEATVV
nr:organic solute transporter subunit alpha-like isoform X2 [Geotrypetes seraphini]XP_033779220.1 organic solute transporter subunit alpha-like isoform X2 [Geotrypetes seraphini]